MDAGQMMTHNSQAVQREWSILCDTGVFCWKVSVIDSGLSRKNTNSLHIIRLVIFLQNYKFHTAAIPEELR